MNKGQLTELSQHGQPQYVPRAAAAGQTHRLPRFQVFWHHSTQDGQLHEEVSGSSTWTHDLRVSASADCVLLYERPQDKISTARQNNPGLVSKLAIMMKNITKVGLPRSRSA